MEFIIFMSKLDIEIIELIKKAKYQIVENTSLCKIDKKFMGFHKGREKTIVICTNNAKLVGNYSLEKILKTIAIIADRGGVNDEAFEIENFKHSCIIPVSAVMSPTKQKTFDLFFFNLLFKATPVAIGIMPPTIADE